jgi:exosortase
MSADRSVPKAAIRRLLPIAGIITLLVVAYGPVVWDLFRIWDSNPQYSHGYLVPVFAIGLLWLRRDSLRIERVRPSVWGLPLIAGGLLIRHLGAYVHIDLIEQFSLLACLPGIVVAIGGAEALRWSWPALAFLLFMLPLPYRIEVAMQGPLQRIATLASTFTMQTFGMSAISRGNVIDINGTPINVAEACSGLSMLTIFFALSTAVAMISRRPLLERLFVVASAIPIAIVANVFRITLIGTLLVLGVRHSIVDAVHERAEFLMMPLALALLWLECSFFSRLIVEEEIDPLRSPLATLAGISGYREGEPQTKVAHTRA